MIARLALATVAAVLAAAAPAAAQATLDPLHPCYASAGEEDAQRERVDIVARGFPERVPVQILFDGRPITTAVTDGDGVLPGVALPAPYVARGQRTFEVEVRYTTDGGTSVRSATGSARVTNLAVTLNPNRARPSRRVRYRGRGFMADAPVWAHYVFNGKPRRTVRLARRPTGPCGAFSVRRRQIPIERPRTGQWRVQIDQRRDYVAEDPGTNWVEILIDVARRFREPEGGRR